MISTLSAAGRTKDVLLLLQHAHKSGVQPDEIMYSVCLQAPILQSPLDMSLCCKLTRALTFQNVSCRHCVSTTPRSPTFAVCCSRRLRRAPRLRPHPHSRRRRMLPPARGRGFRVWWQGRGQVRGRGRGRERG